MVGWLLQIGGALELANNTLAQSKDAKGHDKTWSDYNDNLNNGVIQAHQRPILWLLAISYNGVLHTQKSIQHSKLFEVTKFWVVWVYLKVKLTIVMVNVYYLSILPLGGPSCERNILIEHNHHCTSPCSLIWYPANKKRWAFTTIILLRILLFKRRRFYYLVTN